jgi:hypothetical protein
MTFGHFCPAALSIALGLILTSCGDRKHPGEALFPCRIYSNLGLMEKWGYINAEGKVRIKPVYDDALLFSEGLAFVEDTSILPGRFGPGSGSAYGIIREDGSWALPPQLDLSTTFHMNLYFSEGLFVCEQAGKSGYMDESGHFKIPPKYDSCWPFSNGLAQVQDGGHWHYIGHDGKPKFTDLNLEETTAFQNGRAVVRKGGKWGAIDTLGAWVFPAEYDALQEFAPDRFAFKKGAAYGILDAAGKVSAVTGFEPIVGWCGDGMALFWRSGRVGAADLEHGGVICVTPEWDRLSPFSEGRAAFENRGTSGYIDKSGKIIVDLGSVYDTLDRFKNGLAYVRKNNSHEGYLNKNGKWVFRRNLH